MNLDKVLQLLGADAPAIEAKLEEFAAKIDAIEEPTDVERVPAALRQVATDVRSFCKFIEAIADTLERKLEDGK